MDTSVSNLRPIMQVPINHLSANLTEWSNTLKQFVGKSLSVFDHSVG